jgi:hypothetical protein
LLKRIVPEATLALLLVGMFLLVPNVQPAKAQTTTIVETTLFSLSKFVPPRMVEAPNTHLVGGTNVRIKFNASESIDFFCQNSWEYTQSSSTGWHNVTAHWSDKTAFMNRTFTIPTTDTWYFTLVNYEYHGIDVYDITLYRIETYEIHVESDRKFYGEWQQATLTAWVNKDSQSIAGSDVIFQVLDPYGNVVLNESKQTNAHGQATTIFTLSGEDGMYNASARTAVAEKTIEDFVTFATDITPPTTVTDYNGTWRITDFTVTLTATDNESGVSEVYYRINDGLIQNVSTGGQPLITVESANNRIEYWSIDNAGNIESHHILTGIKLDRMAPTGSIIINNGDPYTNSTSVTLTLTATDLISGVHQVRYSNDGMWDIGTWESPSVTETWNLTLFDGIKTVYYQIKDNAGLVSVTYSTSTILDTDSPIIGTPFRTPDGDVQPGQPVEVSVNVTDVGSGVKSVRLAYTTNKTFPGGWFDVPMLFNSGTSLYEGGIHGQEAASLVKYRITAYDNAGNYKTEDNSAQYYVYTVIPEFQLSPFILAIFIIATLLAATIRRIETNASQFHKVS